MHAVYIIHDICPQAHLKRGTGFLQDQKKKRVQWYLCPIKQHNKTKRTILCYETLYILFQYIKKKTYIIFHSYLIMNWTFIIYQFDIWW